MICKANKVIFLKNNPLNKLINFNFLYTSGDFERIVRIFSNQSIASRRATSTSKYTKRWRTSTPNLTSELNISVSDIRNVKVRELGKSIIN